MYGDKTPESIKESILSNINSLDKREGSFIDDMVSPTSMEIWKAYQAFNTMMQVMFIDTNAGEHIDKRCAEYGIYRKKGVKAKGKATFTGNSNTIIPKDTIIQTIDGLQFITLKEEKIIDAFIEVDIEALQVGKEYNVLANSIVQMVINIPGVTSITNNNPTTSGTDIESDESLVSRFYNILQNAPTSGNVNHYKQWAMEVSGVGDAKIFPLWNGNGTVKVVIVGADKKPADSSIVTNVADYIEINRPIGATVTVISAAALPINISATLTLSTETTLEKVSETFTSNLEDYLKSIAFKTYTVFYNKIGAMLLDIEGVIDYSNLQVNNTMGNIVLGVEEIPTLGTVTLS